MIRNIFVSSTLAVVMAIGAQPASAGLGSLFNKYEQNGFVTFAYNTLLYIGKIK